MCVCSGMHQLRIYFEFGIFRAHFHFHVLMRLNEWMNERMKANQASVCERGIGV